jgi:hypothetical protein
LSFSSTDLADRFTLAPNLAPRQLKAKLLCALSPLRPQDYHGAVDEKKLFWLIFIILSLIADFVLPLLWGLVATIPILFFSWWVVYRSGWIT